MPPAPYVTLVPDILLVNPAPPVSETRGVESLLPPAVVLPPPPPPFSPPTLFPAPFPPVGAVDDVATEPPNPELLFALRLLYPPPPPYAVIVSNIESNPSEPSYSAGELLRSLVPPSPPSPTVILYVFPGVTLIVPYKTKPPPPPPAEPVSYAPPPPPPPPTIKYSTLVTYAGASQVESPMLVYVEIVNVLGV